MSHSTYSTSTPRGGPDSCAPAGRPWEGHEQGRWGCSGRNPFPPPPNPCRSFKTILNPDAADEYAARGRRGGGGGSGGGRGYGGGGGGGGRPRGGRVTGLSDLRDASGAAACGERALRRACSLTCSATSARHALGWVAWAR